jgi:hypothetical protein
VPIGPYVADFICLKARLIVEVDGGQHASTAASRDKVRDAWLRAQQFTILRFWNNDVLKNMDGVLETIAAALERSTPPSRLASHSRRSASAFLNVKNGGRRPPIDLPRKGGGGASI